MIAGETMKNENKKIAGLIKRIQRGNQSAFEEFYKLTSPKAYFIALKITQNEHDAEDVLQESYIKALEKIGEIDTSQNVTSWFLKIVSNKSKDLLKSKNRFVFESEEEIIFDEIPEEKTEFCPEENLNQEELRLEVMAAIDELTDEKRACIMMMYFGDMSVKEIAESIDVPESTVKNRLYTARKDLKSKFEKNGNVLFGAALGGVLAWALSKTSVTASAAFLASAASAEIVAGATAAYTAGATATATAATATTAASTAATTAVSAGTGIAAKIAVVSVAQKIVVGVAATAVIGGSTAGVVTVVKNVTPEKETTTAITEEVTTAPEFLTEYAFAETTFPETTAETVTSTEKETRRETSKRTSTEEHTTAPETESITEAESTTSAGKVKTTKEKTTKAKKTTTEKQTTAVTTAVTTTLKETTTSEVTTMEETTTREETTTQKPTTATTKATTVPTTTEPTTKAKATLIIEVTDFDNNVVATITETVDDGTEITRDYLVSLVRSKGYEAMAGVYGDAIGSVASGGQSYSFTAEL